MCERGGVGVRCHDPPHDEAPRRCLRAFHTVSEGGFSEVRLFRVEEVECFGQRRCEHGSHLERLTRPGVLRSLAHRGGLRADVLSRAVGSEPATDSVEALP